MENEEVSTKPIERGTLVARRDQLSAQLNTGEQTLLSLETKAKEIRNTLNQLRGGIMILNEMLETKPEAKKEEIPQSPQSPPAEGKEEEPK